MAWTDVATLAILAVITGLLLLLRKRQSPETEFLNRRVEELTVENQRLTAEKETLIRETAELKSDAGHLNKRVEELNQMREALTVQFKAVSADILKTQTENQQQSFGQILTPLKEQLTAFQKGMDDFKQTQAAGRGQLDAQLKNLLEMNSRLSDEAKGLANALKGNTKHQGDWGETQLERVFEVAGFQRGINYTVQENVKDEDGHNRRPDYVVNLPNNRRLIVDCKVSLNAYTRYVNADNPDDKKRFLAEHVQALRNHIKGLSGKDYQSKVKDAGLDYVFMFIPVEHAYLAALQADPDIYEAAYKANIAITTASSLLPILRTVENMWRIERQNRNVQQIADIGGKLHDKLVAFVEDMQDIDKALSKAKLSYDNAFKKLSEGKGNAIGWAAKLKQQGAKAAKDFTVDYDDEDVPLIENGQPQ
ncbi:MAG TPA: DNA recombination protein RmuC [Alphaproteobacteria bacterium]|nr:DNA recombination protein RmuC [Alphaproteobacteria bacterium]